MAKRRVTPIDPAFGNEDIPDVGYVAPPGEVLVDEPAVVRPKRPIRHSDIPANVDAFRYVRENGYTNPVRKYRVTPMGKPEQVARLRSLEIDAVDEAAAINEFITRSAIPAKIVHAMNFRAVKLED